jgi:tRNA-specific 2-thiouridylase
MRILAALSGGVDSAVAAALLRDGGADVVGVHLRTGVEEAAEGAGGGRSCCGADDARDAREVAAALGIPFYVVDVKEAFAGVVDAFVRAYASGRTPNPCVDCNKHVKFGRLREIAKGLGASAVATGHYARVEAGPSGRMRLLRPADARKDQTYVLFPLDQEQLRDAVFPLAALTKDEVRARARALGLAVAAKRDSQELCFVPGGDYRAFLRAHAPESLVPGAFVDEEGRPLGRHEGAAGFTRGQRRGLPPGAEARHVAAVDGRGGNVVLASRDRLLDRRVAAHDLNWIEVAEPPAGASFRVRARIRHAAPPADATLTVVGDGTVDVVFDEPVFAAAPGQALVAYVGDAVLCGGTIGGAGSSAPPPVN